MQKERFRHEYKYLCTEGQLADLENRVKAIMKKDAHVNGRPFYGIRSLYFDDLYHSCFYQNEDGTDPRHKWRIRIYDGNSSVVKLERKGKERGMTCKDSCSVSRELADCLLKGEKPKETIGGEELPFLLKCFLTERETNGLSPKVIVDYERTPYVFPSGNVRVTFDRNIGSAPANEAFWDKRIYKRPIMPLGQQLMEVKFDEYLPDFIYRALNAGDLQRTTFSKYYLCRKFSI